METILIEESIKCEQVDEKQMEMNFQQSEHKHNLCVRIKRLKGTLWFEEQPRKMHGQDLVSSA